MFPTLLRLDNQAWSLQGNETLERIAHIKTTKHLVLKKQPNKHSVGLGVSEPGEFRGGVVMVQIRGCFRPSRLLIILNAMEIIGKILV